MVSMNRLLRREQLRDARKQHFFVLIGLCIGLAVLLMVVVHTLMSVQLHQQLRRNQYLQNQIAILDRQVKKVDHDQVQTNKRLTRMRMIDALNSDRATIVHLFADLVDCVPPGLTVTKLERQDAQMTLVGRSESNQMIAQLMRQLAASIWFSHPMLIQIDDDRGTTPHHSDFKLVVNTVASRHWHPDSAQAARKKHAKKTTKRNE
jgi:type IV pilus assembly protein PilN